MSGLLAGFGALELHVSCIRFTRTVVWEAATVQDVARELCLFFGRAPASYRRFSIYWTTQSLAFQFTRGGSADNVRYTDAECDSVSSLAAQMQNYAGAHRLRIAIANKPAKHLLVTRGDVYVSV